MRAAVGKNMYVMCSDNIKIAQQFFLLPLNFFNTKILIHNLAHTTSNFKCYFPQPVILKSTFQITPPEVKFKFLRLSELAVAPGTAKVEPGLIL